MYVWAGAELCTRVGAIAPQDFEISFNIYIIILISPMMQFFLL